MKLEEIREEAVAEDETPLRYWDWDGAVIVSWKSGHDAWIYQGGNDWVEFEDTWTLKERGDEITEEVAAQMIAGNDKARVTPR